MGAYLMVVWIWIAFIAFILALLTLDLCVLNRKTHVIRAREALLWTGFWVSLALGFNVLVYFMYEYHWLGMGQLYGRELSGRDASLQFFAAYLVEESLSLDNIFVIALIFTYFKVPAQFQHRVLFWGIVGAQVMRGMLILAGTALLHRFEWLIYIFGALLIFSAIKLLITGDDDLHPEENPLVKVARRVFPMTPEFVEARFFVRLNGRLAATPLFLVLLVVESTDLLFALDSIPACLAVTRDPFLVFTSNIFAILGLRSLYFALAAVLDKFRYLKTSLVFLLCYIGVKMLISHYVHIPIQVTLAVIAGILFVGVAASVVVSVREKMKAGNGDLTSLTLSQAKRIVIFVLGGTILLAGLTMLLIPGPGIATVIAGLALLGTEFVWARRLLRKVRDTAGQAYQTITGRAGSDVVDEDKPEE